MGIAFGRTKLTEAIDAFERDYGRKLTREERNIFAAGWFAGRP